VSQRAAKNTDNSQSAWVTTMPALMCSSLFYHTQNEWYADFANITINGRKEESVAVDKKALFSADSNDRVVFWSHLLIYGNMH
jgi:hypothetical protein